MFTAKVILSTSYPFGVFCKYGVSVFPLQKGESVKKMREEVRWIFIFIFFKTWGQQDKTCSELL